MKKWLASTVAVLFLAAASGPLFAAPATPGPTSGAKSAKHSKKKTHKKKGTKSSKASSTPTAK